MKIANAPTRRNRSLDDALLPLVNIVFLLMVFFLFAGHWGAPAHKSTPRSTQAQSRPPASLVLELKTGLQMRLAGNTFSDSELPQYLGRYPAQALDIRAEGGVPASRVLRAMAVLQAAGLTDLRLLAVRQRSTP